MMYCLSTTFSAYSLSLALCRASTTCRVCSSRRGSTDAIGRRYMQTHKPVRWHGRQHMHPLASGQALYIWSIHVPPKIEPLCTHM